MQIAGQGAVKQTQGGRACHGRVPSGRPVVRSCWVWSGGSPHLAFAPAQEPRLGTSHSRAAVCRGVWEKPSSSDDQAALGPGAETPVKSCPNRVTSATLRNGRFLLVLQSEKGSCQKLPRPFLVACPLVTR